MLSSTPTSFNLFVGWIRTVLFQFPQQRVFLTDPTHVPMAERKSFSNENMLYLKPQPCMALGSVQLTGMLDDPDHNRITQGHPHSDFTLLQPQSLIPCLFQVDDGVWRGTGGKRLVRNARGKEGEEKCSGCLSG